MSDRAFQYSLRYGSAKNPVAEVIPDKTWPGMWRVRTPDRSLSDMANLSRAKDAALAIAERGPPAKDAKLLRWEMAPLGEALGGSLVSQNAKGAPTPRNSTNKRHHQNLFKGTR
jgi:hypothetical protein